MKSIKSRHAPSVVACIWLMIFAVGSLSPIVHANGGDELSGHIVNSEVASSGGEYELVATVGSPGIHIAGGGGYELAVSVDPGDKLELIDYEELAAFAVQWLETAGSFTADLDGDGDVGMADLSLLAERWLDFSPQDWHL